MVQANLRHGAIASFLANRERVCVRFWLLLDAIALSLSVILRSLPFDTFVLIRLAYQWHGSCRIFLLSA